MKAFRCVVYGLLLMGVWQLGSGAYVHAKARFAQVLIGNAWDRTLAGEHQVKPWPWADTWPVARLRYPGHHVDLMVLANGTGRSLAFGPGHLAGSAPPGASGNTVIAAHRDTHFAFLEDIVVNDRLTLETDEGLVTWYQVTDTQIVSADDTVVALEMGDQVLTLVTCYPFDSLRAGGPLRYVVTARAVSDFEPSVAATR